jgi:hypothetical protein
METPPSVDRAIRTAENKLGVSFGYFHAVVALFSAYSFWKGLSFLAVPGIQETFLKEPSCRDTNFVVSDLSLTWLTFATIGSSLLTLQDPKAIRKGFRALFFMVLPCLVFTLQSLANDHLYTEGSFISVIFYISTMISCLFGLSYYNRDSLETGSKNFQIHDIIEIALFLPNIFLSLALVASPWSILSSYFQGPLCRSMVITEKLVGSAMLGLLSAKALSIGCSSIQFRHAMVRGITMANFLALIYCFVMFSFRDVFVPESQIALFLFTLIQTGLRLYQLYKFPELMTTPRRAVEEMKEQVVGRISQLSPGIAQGIQKGPINIPIQEKKST